MWGHRVIIPPQGRKQLLDELNVAHPGIERMKSPACSYLWWPGMDADIKQKVKHCNQYLINQRKLPVMPLHPWEWPGKPWSRIHLDYVGTYFSSQGFQTFVKQDRIQHVRTAAYHPSSNDLAERYVQIAKDGLKKITLGSVESRLARLLSHYRVTPQSTTGVSHAELMFGRKLRTRLGLLQPDLGNKVRQ